MKKKLFIQKKNTTPILKKYIKYYYAMSNISEYLMYRKDDNDDPENYEVMDEYSLEVYYSMLEEKGSVYAIAEDLIHEMDRVQAMIEGLIHDSHSSCSLTIEGYLFYSENYPLVKIGSVTFNYSDKTPFNNYIPTYDHFCEWIGQARHSIAELADIKEDCNKYNFKFFVDRQLTIQFMTDF